MSLLFASLVSDQPVTHDDIGTVVEQENMGGPPSRTVLFVVNTVEYGGLEKDLIELACRFASDGLEISILCLGPDFYTQRLRERGNCRTDVKCVEEPKYFWQWVKLLKSIGPQVVVFDYGSIWAFPWYASLAAWLAGIRKRLSIQQLIALPTPRIEKWSVRNILRRCLGGRTRRLAGLKISNWLCQWLAGATICVSKAVRELLIKEYRFPEDSTVTVYNGVSTTEFIPSLSNRVVLRSRLGLGSDEVLLVCVARLSEIKGIDILLLAMAQVVRQGVQCRCLIVGGGPLRDSLHKQAELLGVSDAVLFQGFQADVKPFLQASDVFVLTSHAEGLPLSILEAMACGLPCVVTDVGGNAEAISSGVNGLIVKPGSVEEVARAISYIVTHGDERSRMSKLARVKVCDAFDMNNRAEQIKRLILN